MLGALQESCIPCPAAKIQPQAAPLPPQDTTGEPLLFLWKLAMTQGRPRGNNGLWSGGRAEGGMGW